MMTVHTKLAPSPLAGIGLFADEDIPKGTVVWKFNPTIDLLLSEDKIKSLSDAAQRQVHNYAYFDEQDGAYILCGDDARFFNHADNPNCVDLDHDTVVAAQDIKKGKELTADYRAFISDTQHHKEVFGSVNMS